VSQCRKIVERQIFGHLNLEVLGQLAEQLSFLNTVDAEVGLEIDIQFDHLGRVAGLFDDKIDQKRLQFRITLRPGSCRF